jgi:hypothetical protein
MRKRLAYHRRYRDFIVLRIWPTGGPPVKWADKARHPPSGWRLDTARLAALEA